MLLLLLLLKSFIFFGMWFMELTFGFRPTETIGWFFYGNDAHSYLDPIESLVDEGSYKLEGVLTAFRMPGFFPIYGPLYFLFGKSLALNLFGIFGFLIEALSVRFMYIMIRSSFTQKAAFFACLIYILFPRLSMYSYLGMTEGLAAAMLIFMVFYYWKSKDKVRYLWHTGFFVSWFIFLKPIGGILLPVIGVVILIEAFLAHDRRNKVISIVLRRLAIVMAIPALCISLWTIRNYLTFERFMPLTTAFQSSTIESSFKRFCRTTGLEFQTWSREDAMIWFLPPSHPSFNEEYAQGNPFPDQTFTSSFNYDSLIGLRSDWNLLQEERFTESDSITMAASIIDRFEQYSASFRAEKPFRFYIGTRLEFIKRFLVIKDSFAPFAQNSAIFLSIRVWFFLSYFALVGIGIIGWIEIMFSRKNGMLFPGSILLAFVLVHIALGIIENRYVLPIVPIFTFGIASLVDTVQKRFIRS